MSFMVRGVDGLRSSRRSPAAISAKKKMMPQALKMHISTYFKSSTIDSMQKYEPSAPKAVNVKIITTAEKPKKLAAPSCFSVLLRKVILGLGALAIISRNT